jgi:hypothetical protein
VKAVLKIVFIEALTYLLSELLSPEQYVNCGRVLDPNKSASETPPTGLIHGAVINNKGSPEAFGRPKNDDYFFT